MVVLWLSCICRVSSSHRMLCFPVSLSFPSVFLFRIIARANDDVLLLAVEAHTESILGSVVAALDARREKGF